MLPAMAIRDWPSAERPREKLLERGASALSDAELLAILLRNGTVGHSALDLARAVLAHFGSLRHLVAADHPVAAPADRADRSVKSRAVAVAMLKS